MAQQKQKVQRIKKILYDAVTQFDAVLCDLNTHIKGFKEDAPEYLDRIEELSNDLAAIALGVGSLVRVAAKLGQAIGHMQNLKKEA